MKNQSSGPILLLVLAFVLAGAKTPLAFCAWAFIALVFVMAVLKSGSFTFRSTLYFLGLTADLFLTQIYSLDPSNSFLWSIEFLVLACLWFSLTVAPVDSEPDFFWRILTGLAIVTAAITAFQWVSKNPPYGALPLNPNFNAVWMAALASALAAKERRTPLESALFAGLALLVLHGSSRSGLLALMVGVFYTWLQRYPARKVFLGLACAGFIGWVLLPHAWILERLNLYENGGRLRIWGLALRSILDYPLTGYGAGNFEIAYQRHAFPVSEWVRYGRTTGFAHNDYLQIAVEFGWPLAALTISGLITASFASNRHRRPLAEPARAILLVLGVAAFFNPILKMPIFAYLAILAAACLTSPETNPSSSARHIRGCKLLWVPAAAMVFVLVCGVRSFWAGNHQWSRILACNSHDSEAWHELAYSSSDIRDILLAHEHAVHESPHQIYYVEALAHTLESMPAPNMISRAIEAYLRAISLAPSRAIDYLGVARLLYRAGEPGQALKWTERALSLEPYYWESDLWRARCFDRLGDKKRAGEILRTLIERHDHFALLFPRRPESPYEQAILGYDRSLVENELSPSRAREVVNGVK